jgi:hypothetical protein
MKKNTGDKYILKLRDTTCLQLTIAFCLRELHKYRLSVTINKNAGTSDKVPASSNIAAFIINLVEKIILQ